MENPQSQPNTSDTFTYNPIRKKYTALFIMVGVIGFIVFLVILNFVNILPLSKSMPSVFGWLPYQKGAQNLTQTIEKSEIGGVPIEQYALMELTNPKVTRIYLTYSLDRLSISKIDPEKRTVTLRDPENPKFYLEDILVASDAAIFEMRQGGERIEKGFSDLKVSIPIGVTLTLDLKTEEWIMRGIAMQSATTQGQPKQ